MPEERKPPIGLTPKFIHDSNRERAIKEAVNRYMEVDMPIPLEWIDEYNDLVKK